MNIVVLAGGLSSEREVSLTSGYLITKALIEKGYNAILLDVFLGYEGVINDYQGLFNNFKINKHEVNEIPPTIEEIKNKRDSNIKGLFGENVLELCKYADKVFIALHGADGENGKVQATFDLLDIKYTGSGPLGSALAMNKKIAKQIMKDSDIKTPKEEIVTKENITLTLDYPVVVKPLEGGSSIGVSIVNNENEFREKVNEILNFENEVLVEEYIKGREFSVGVLGDKALPPIEIIPKQGFYDYKNKYQKELTIEICPADLSEQETETIKNFALKTHKALLLETYSRIDFILDDKGIFYCLEANSLPGMTPLSLFPQEAKEVGINFNDLCERLLLTEKPTNL